MRLDREEEWLAACLENLDYGYIDGIVAATRKYPFEGVKKAEVDTVLGYFEANAPRMRCEVAQEFANAGFDHLVTMNAGPDPDGFMDFFARELAAPLRALTPAAA
jgi:hypothetical protein